MQTLYAVAVDIEGDPSSSFDGVLAGVADWALAGEVAPDGFLTGRAEADAGGKHLRWEAVTVAGRAHRYCRLEVCSPLADTEGAEFVCEVVVAQTDANTAVGIELGRRATVVRLAPAPLDFVSRPRIVPWVLNNFGCYYEKDRVRAVPRKMKATAVPDVLALLDGPDRPLPVVVVSSTADGSPEARLAAAMADRLAGLAHVVLLETWLALESFNAQSDLRVPLRGARLFWPKAAKASRHPWWTGSQLRDGPSVNEQVFGMLARLSVVANARGTGLVEQVRAEERRVAREMSDRRVAEATAAGDTRLLVDELRQQLDVERGQVLELLQLNEDLETENGELRIYRENFEALTQWQETPAGTTASEPRLEDLQVSADFRELWPALEQETDGALVFTDGAKDSWIRSGYPYADRMREVLETLARAAAAWREQSGRLGKSMVSWLGDEYGLHYAPDDDGMRRLKIDTFAFEGREYSRLPHIKIDDNVTPDRVGRVYFATDEQDRRWVVDHVGIKLHGV